jgi:hypothetical protein
MGPTIGVPTGTTMHLGSLQKLFDVVSQNIKDHEHVKKDDLPTVLENLYITSENVVKRLETNAKQLNLISACFTCLESLLDCKGMENGNSVSSRFSCLANKMVESLPLITLITKDDILHHMCHSASQMITIQAKRTTQISFHLMTCICRLSYQIILNEMRKMNMSNEDELESLSAENFDSFKNCEKKLKDEDESTRRAWYELDANHMNAMAELQSLKLPGLKTRQEDKTQQVNAEARKSETGKKKRRRQNPEHKGGSLDSYLCISLYGMAIMENLEKAQRHASTKTTNGLISLGEIENKYNENIRRNESELKGEIDKIIKRCQTDSMKLRRDDRQTEIENALHLLFTLHITTICRSVHTMHSCFVLAVDGCTSKELENMDQILRYFNTLANLDDFKSMDVLTLDKLRNRDEQKHGCHDNGQIGTDRQEMIDKTVSDGAMATDL